MLWLVVVFIQVGSYCVIDHSDRCSEDLCTVYSLHTTPYDTGCGMAAGVQMQCM